MKRPGYLFLSSLLITASTNRELRYYIAYLNFIIH